MKLIFVVMALLGTSVSYSQKLIRGKITGIAQNKYEYLRISDHQQLQLEKINAGGKFDFYSKDSIFYLLEKDVKIDSFIVRNEKFIVVNVRNYTNQLESIIVSNHLQNQRNIWTNPVAITAVSAKQVENTISSNLIDGLVKNTPGLNAVKTGPNISKPFIRGLGYNRVLTLFDGIRQEGQQWGDEHGIELDPYNIGNTEVIKGPASMIYGSDAEAGVVSLRSFQPQVIDGKIHGQWISEYQNNNGLYGNGVSIYKRNAHWYWLGAGSYRIAKNYQNKIDGRVYNTGFKEINLSLKTGYQSKNGFSNLNFTLYNNLQGIPDGSRDSLTRKFTKQIYESEEDNIKDRPIVSDRELNSYSLSPLHQHIQHYRIYSDNEYSLKNGGKISGLVAFQQNIRREYNHPTMPEQAGMYVKLNTLNFTGKYQFAPIGKFTNTIGVNGMYQSNRNENATDFPIPDYKLGDLGIYAFSNFESGKWTISGGIRIDQRWIRSKDFYTGTNDVTGFEYAIRNHQDTLGANLQFPALHLQYSGVSASLGVTYEVNENIHLKANVAKGYRAPNITEIASNGLDPGAHIYYIGNRNFVPEFNIQEDIGVSLNYSDLNANFSVFNNHISHYISLMQLTDANGNPVQLVPGNWTYQYQQSAARLYGLESNFQYFPKYLNGIVLESSIALVYGNNTSAKYKNAGTNGEYLAYIPPVKWVSGVEKVFQLKSQNLNKLKLKLEYEFNGKQSRYFGLYDTETATPGYSLLNVFVGCTIQLREKQTIDVNVFADNILDKAFQSNLSRLKYFEYYNSSPNGHYGIYGMGRNIGVKVGVHF